MPLGGIRNPDPSKRAGDLDGAATGIGYRLGYISITLDVGYKKRYNSPTNFTVKLSIRYFVISNTLKPAYILAGKPEV
jgi:hypothetical protein